MHRKRTEFFKLKVDCLQVEQVENKYFAHWAATKWADCLRIGIPISRTLEQILGLGEGTIQNIESHEYFGDTCLPSVTFYYPSAIEDIPITIDQKLAEGVIADFLCLTLKKNNKNLGLFQATLKDEDIKNTVKQHADKFLNSTTSQKLSTPITIECFSLDESISGNFSPKPPVSTTKEPEPIAATCRVIEMNAKERSCILTEQKNKFNVHYNENSHFRKLKKLLGEPLTAAFQMNRTLDADGNDLITLDSFAEIKKDPNLLI